VRKKRLKLGGRKKSAKEERRKSSEWLITSEHINYYKVI